MQPSARLEAVIDILQALDATAQPADRLLRDWFRSRRYAGSKDRAAIGERVFAILRARAALSRRMGGDAPRALTIASLLAEGLAPDGVAALFDGKGYGPSPLSAQELHAIASPPTGEAPLWVRCEFPSFLEPELTRAFGDALADEMSAFSTRAPVDLRVNALKATRENVLAALQSDGFAAEPTPYAPHGVRLPPGTGSAKLGTSALFASGAFEFQDEAAQIASILCGAKPGMRVLDLAAGAGGKSLALAAEMQNRGEIVAHDITEKRLQPLHARATRAGAHIIRATHQNVTGSFDVVLADAPCSGSGTWRRQPELRWRITPERLKELADVQDSLLETGAKLTQPGGRLVYATCSLFPCENEDRVAQFLIRHAGFAVFPAAEAWREAAGTAPPPGMERFFKATPRQTGTDGFFVGILQRQTI